VEYTITALGEELLEHVQPLWLWVARSVGRFQTARACYDAREPQPAVPQRVPVWELSAKV
jgi:DNA-binding HxlR family transcriptional regulator